MNWNFVMFYGATYNNNKTVIQMTAWLNKAILNNKENTKPLMTSKGFIHQLCRSQGMQLGTNTVAQLNTLFREMTEWNTNLLKHFNTIRGLHWEVCIYLMKSDTVKQVLM